MRAVIIAMNRCPLGAACVGAEGELLGLITDGDLRRALETIEDIRDVKASDLMTVNPITIGPDATLQEAMRNCCPNGCAPGHSPLLSIGIKCVASTHADDADAAINL